jgi:hypothetical protein
MIKKLMFFVLLVFSMFSSNAQQGFLNLNDFNPLNNPNGPYNESIYWLRGTTPPGNIRIMSYRGTFQARFHQDSFFFPKLSLREDGAPYKLVSIGSDSMFRAFTPTYLVPADTVAKWIGIGTTIPAAQVSSDWNSVSGVSQILNKPTLKRIETYLGTTDGSGNYTVTYSSAFSVTPDVQPQIQVASVTQAVRITATSTTGFTIQVTNRAVTTLLGIDLISGTSTPVSGASVGVLVTSR